MKSVPDIHKEGAVNRRRARRNMGRRYTLVFGIAWLLAWRGLAHDPVRFAVTVVGVAFSVMLMGIQWGLLVGSAETASGLINHTAADFWIASRGTSNVDQALPLPERWRFKALTIPDVASVEPLLVQFAGWRRPDGRAEYVIVVGFDLDSGIGGPWNFDGSAEDLRQPDAIVIDRLYAEKLGVQAVGQTIEIGGKRARVVGFTQGIRAFTQSPYVFTPFKNAHRYANYDNEMTTYLLVRAAPGADHDKLEQRLRAALPAADVWSGASFASATAWYWLFTTGAGTALVVGAGLGIIIGIVIVAQTLYASTVEHLKEYATILAIGAPARYLNRIVLRQALVSGVFGYTIGLAVMVASVDAAAATSIPLVMPWQLAVVVAVVAIAMCCAAALVAIYKIKRIDPTMVFQ